jgi:hypothetical protein
MAKPRKGAGTTRAGTSETRRTPAARAPGRPSLDEPLPLERLVGHLKTLGVRELDFDDDPIPF